MDNDEGLSQGRTDNDGHEMTENTLSENDYIVKSQNVLSFLKDFIPFNGAATNGDVLHYKRAVCYTAHYRLGSGIILAEDNKRKKNENLVFHGKLKSLNGGNFYHLPER